MKIGRIISHLRVLLASHKAKEFAVFGFFVLLSATAWLMQVLRENYDVEITIPLLLDNVPEDVVITDSITRSISIKANNRGTTLVPFFIGSKQEPLRLSFGDYNTSRAIGTVHISATEILKRAQTFMPPSTSILRVVSDSVQFSYNRGVKRRLPVRINGTMTAQQHTYIRGLAITPDSVDVYATPNTLDTMTVIDTQPVKVNDLKADTRMTLYMGNQRGIKCVPDTVSVLINVDSYTEKSVEVPITGVNFPKGKSLRTFPGKIMVTFRVGLANYNDVTAEQFTLNVDYNELIKTNICHPRLQSLATNISNMRLSQKEVDFLIEQEAE